MLLLLVVVLFCTGCPASPGINTQYGRRRGAAGSSVNGTSVLARMFQTEGHRVITRSGAAPLVDDCNVIVWAPDVFQPPTIEERQVIEEWVTGRSGRTFIYIGRDYDAAIGYWRDAVERSSTNGDDEAKSERHSAREYYRRLANARSEHEARRLKLDEESNVDWFVARRTEPRLRVKQLTGPWASGIDTARADIRLRTRFEIPTDREQASIAQDLVDKEGDGEQFNEEQFNEEQFNEEQFNEEQFNELYWEPQFNDIERHIEVLLAAGDALAGEDSLGEGDSIAMAAGSPLVTRIMHSYWPNSQVIVVTNGSFLLNLPLVNHEHRKLAVRLIDECGDKPLKVGFWDGNAFRPSSGEQVNEWSVLTTWPLNLILLHLAIMGILFILWRFPVFGPAKDLPPPATSDFAKHISALGDLMATTGDAAYARDKLATYQKTVRNEEGSE